MSTPDYCEGCNQRFAPIDQQSCWGCKDGDLNSSQKRARTYSREEIEKIKDGLICDEVCANHHGLAYIHQLESTVSQVSKALCGKENATLDEVLKAVSQVKNALEMARGERDAVNKNRIDLAIRLAQVEKERDAAVHDLEELTTRVSSLHLDCDYCKDKEKPICNNCEWQWRGVCEENSK